MLSPKETMLWEDSTSTLKIETLIHTDEKNLNAQFSYEMNEGKKGSGSYSSEFIALFKFNFGQTHTPEERSIDTSSQELQKQSHKNYSEEASIEEEDNIELQPSPYSKQRAKELSLLDLSSSKDSFIKEFDEYNEHETDNIFDLSKSMIYNEMISIK